MAVLERYLVTLTSVHTEIGHGTVHLEAKAQVLSREEAETGLEQRMVVACIQQGLDALKAEAARMHLWARIACGVLALVNGGAPCLATSAQVLARMHALLDAKDDLGLCTLTLFECDALQQDLLRALDYVILHNLVNTLWLLLQRMSLGLLKAVCQRALCLAASYGRVQGLEILLHVAFMKQLPLNLNARNGTGYTALMCACLSGHADIVQRLVPVLLEQGYSLQATHEFEDAAWGSLSWTALDMAKHKKHDDIVRLLEPLV